MNVFWRMADPFLLRMRARMEHLDQHAPSRRRDEELRRMGEISPNAQFFDSTSIDNFGPRANLKIGDFSWIKGGIRLLTEKSNVTIGHHSYLGPESQIMAQESVTIGNFVLIAQLVDVIDTNSHSLDWRERREEAIDAFERRWQLRQARVPSAPIVIEDDVWIGTKCTVLKGVRIGRGAVIAANSLVTEDVEPFTLVGGNPLRVIRKLEEGKP